LKVNDLNKVSRIALTGATFRTGNLGVTALTKGIIASIIKNHPDAEIDLIEYATESASYELNTAIGNKTIRQVNIRYSWKLYLPNNIIILILVAILLRVLPASKIKSKIASKNRYLSEINKADFIGAISGGDSFSDIYGLRRFFYVSLPQILVILLEKQLVLLPQTIGPFTGYVPRMIAKYILSQAALVYSRDYEGMNYTKNLLEEKSASNKVRFCYDVAFALEAEMPDKLDLDGMEKQIVRPLVGFNVSGLLYMGGYTKNNMFELKIDYKILVSNIIDMLINGRNARILLIPHVFGPAGEGEHDSAVFAKIYTALKEKYKDKIYLARGTYTANEIKWVIGLCDFFVGSRMHACIAAVSQGIPTVSIAYSNKFRGVMETVKMDKYVADPREMNEDNILKMIATDYDKREMIKKNIENEMPNIKKRVLRLFKEIEEELKINRGN
jgi:colanic acid/amylovoran biosynthesis protein